MEVPAASPPIYTNPLPQTVLLNPTLLTHAPQSVPVTSFGGQLVLLGSSSLQQLPPPPPPQLILASSSGATAESSSASSINHSSHQQQQIRYGHLGFVVRYSCRSVEGWDEEDLVEGDRAPSLYAMVPRVLVCRPGIEPATPSWQAIAPTHGTVVIVFCRVSQQQ